MPNLSGFSRLVPYAGRVTEWTVGTIKEHFDALRAADLDAVQTALATAEKAVAVAGTEASARLEAHNGLIAQMRDQAGAFAPVTLSPI